jgi:hypothetical protein
LFFDHLIERVLDVTPVEMHVAVRENREGEDLEIAEGEAWDATPLT